MKKLIFTFFFLVPVSSLASVRVNEIAWMGTAVSSSNEWIELYNDGDTSADLSGWTLSAEGAGKLLIPLSGTLAPKSFFILERTNDDTVPRVAADQVYTGALGNGGEVLALKDGSGAEIQRINASSGWQAGDNTTKETMQWSGEAWVTALATPKAENALPHASAASPKSKEEEEEKAGGVAAGSEVSAHSSPVPLSDFSEKPEWSVSAGRERIAPAGGVLLFEAHARDEKGKSMEDAAFLWSFGDGFSGNGAEVSHFYEYPGNYIVVLNAIRQGAQAVARTAVRVFASDVVLLLAESGVVFSNRSAYEMNVGGWKLRAGEQIYVLPEDTIIGAKEDVVFSSAAAKFQTTNGKGVELLNPSGKVVVRTEAQPEKPPSNPVIANTRDRRKRKRRQLQVQAKS
ncbi:MAG: lamin tail domain-containing protein [Parcubacteria group bacterium]|nr:lamin tail domain-containing protein [Parcubacteria group bacterium]